MPMPGRPGSMFVFIHAELTFALLKALLDRPAHGRGLDQLCKGSLFGRIGDGVFYLSIDIFSQKQSLPVTDRQTVSGQIYLDTGHLGKDGSLGPFGDNFRFPGKTL